MLARSPGRFPVSGYAVGTVACVREGALGEHPDSKRVEFEDTSILQIASSYHPCKLRMLTLANTSTLENPSSHIRIGSMLCWD